MKNNKYLYLVLGTIILLFAGLIYAWSIFKLPLQNQFPELTGENLSLTFTISMIIFCIGGIISGLLSNKINFRIRLIFSAILLGLGFFLISQINEGSTGRIAGKLYIYYGFMCGLGVGISYNTTLGSVMKWFQDRAGFASGVLLMGFGFGSLILGGLASKLTESFGIMKTFFILAFSAPLVIILCTFLLKEPEILADRSKTSQPFNAGSRNFSPTQMLRDKFFWLFTLWTILISSSGLMVINNAAGIAGFFGAPAIVGLIMSVFNGVGRVIIGSVYDKSGAEMATYFNGFILLTSALLMVIGASINNFVPVFLGLLTCGLSYGGAPSLSSALIKGRYGSKHYPLNLSIMNLQIAISASLGPAISDFLLRKSRGNFNTSFYAIGVLAIVSIVLTSLMYSIEKN